MDERKLSQLEGVCETLRPLRDQNIDGSGTNLYDIKNTFDYVTRTLETEQLTGTQFGENLSSHSKNASAVLGELCNCLESLEKAVMGFVEDQRQNNNGR